MHFDNRLKILKTGSLLPAFFFGACLFALVRFFSVLSPPPLAPGVFETAWALTIGFAGFRIMQTGRVSPWRSIIFIIIAAAFVIHFKLPFFHESGRQADCAPFCHIAMASTALNFFHGQIQALANGNRAAAWPLTAGFLWLAVTLILGTGWCSWVCFYGGLDEFFSRLLPRIFRPRIGDRLRCGVGKYRDFQSALLIFLLLVSLSTLTPVFCLWVCPLKMTTSFLSLDTAARYTQMTLMLAAGIIFLAGFSLLLGKRVFCGLICPFGAWQAFAGRINPFRVTVEKSKCVRCGLCMKACPNFSIVEKKDKLPEILSYCCMCGLCVDICPEKCIEYTIRGSEISLGCAPWAKLLSARAMFVFCALVLAGTLGALIVPAALYDVFKLGFRLSAGG